MGLRQAIIRNQAGLVPAQPESNTPPSLRCRVFTLTIGFHNVNDYLTPLPDFARISYWQATGMTEHNTCEIVSSPQQSREDQRWDRLTNRLRTMA